jgi:hypothetical protein
LYASWYVHYISMYRSVTCRCAAHFRPTEHAGCIHCIHSSTAHRCKPWRGPGQQRRCTGIISLCPIGFIAARLSASSATAASCVVTYYAYSHEHMQTWINKDNSMFCLLAGTIITLVYYTLLVTWPYCSCKCGIHNGWHWAMFADSFERLFSMAMQVLWVDREHPAAEHGRRFSVLLQHAIGQRGTVA